MDSIFERIKPGGEIELPKGMMESLQLKVGEEVELKLKGREVLIRPKRNIVDETSGVVNIDPKLAEEIIEDKELEMEMLED